MKRTRWLFLLLGMVVLVIAIAILVGISLAKVELTEHGVHTRLLVPVGSHAIGLTDYAGTGEDVLLPGYLDGPVVRRSADGSWTASWFCEGSVKQSQGKSAALRVECAGRSSTYALDSAPVPSAVAPMPNQLAVLSDLEGNIQFLDAALAKLGIVGSDGRWTYGHGELVVLGDNVDRGRDVFAVLWRLHDLALQAHAAGGAIRMVLGNHDQYILRGNISRTHPEHRYALQAMGGASQAFAADTVIGAWLRAQPVALKLGRVLFVHGGVSPQVADAGLSVKNLNDAMRDYWQTAPGTALPSKKLDAVIGNAGVTQYRGYFHALDGVFPMATTSDVDRVLEHFDAYQIVVAHTVVERVELLQGRRVYAVDVNDDEARPEVLVYNHGIPAVVNIGVSRALATHPVMQTREFSLLESKDRHLLAAMMHAYRQLSAMPQPY